MDVARKARASAADYCGETDALRERRNKEIIQAREDERARREERKARVDYLSNIPPEQLSIAECDELVKYNFRTHCVESRDDAMMRQVKRNIMKDERELKAKGILK